MKTYEALRNIIAAMGVAEELDEQLKATALRILDEIEKRTESAAAEKKKQNRRKRRRRPLTSAGCTPCSMPDGASRRSQRSSAALIRLCAIT